MLVPCAALLGCSDAAPVDLGSDVVLFPEAEIAQETPDGASNDDGVKAFDVVEPFVGGASGHCESSFLPCGGYLAGSSWVVEDTCTSLGMGNRALQREGSELLGLDVDACRSVVQSLTARWAGELAFEAGFANDDRLRARRFDIEVGPECFNATFGVEASDDITPALCESLEDSLTSCAPSATGCTCSAVTVDFMVTSGVYRALGSSVAIDDGFDDVIDSGTPKLYDYCVQGNRLLWADPGTNTHIVMRRRYADVAAPAGPEDPR